MEFGTNAFSSFIGQSNHFAPDDNNNYFFTSSIMRGVLRI